MAHNLSRNFFKCRGIGEIDAIPPRLTAGGHDLVARLRTSGERASIATRPPARANSRAADCPIPREAPVTTTMRPLILMPVFIPPLGHTL